MNAYVIDIESNELYPFNTETWCVCIKKVDSDERLCLHPFELDKLSVKHKVLEFIFQEPNPIIIGHNFLGFDGWVLWRDYGLKISVGPDTFSGLKCTYFDTIFASQFLLPDREGFHRLSAWGDYLGLHKIDYRTVALEAGIITPEENEFVRWSPQMDVYCMRDVEVAEQIYLLLSQQIEDEGSWQGFRLGQKNFWLMKAQAATGFKFDTDKAVALKARIEAMIKELKDDVEPQLPKRKLKKAEEALYRLPAKPFTKDGSYSAILKKKIEEYKAIVLPGGKTLKIGDKIIEILPHAFIIDELPMELGDQNALKDWFLSIGWEPSMYNYQKGKDGRPIRDANRKLIQTSPKIQEAGKICENLLELDGELPAKIVKFMSLRNRLGILTGWLEDRRLAFDGRLSAGSSGIASTHRQRHTTVVNVPKAQDDVLLGKEFRSLFTVEKGFKLIGCDQAALEARCEAHWVYQYDQVAALELIDGDIHSKNAKAFYPLETQQYDIKADGFNKDDPNFKPYRSKSKNGKYAVTYGASAGKLAKTLGQPERKGKILFEAFWAANPGLKQLKDQIEYNWQKQGGKVWILGIDGRRLHSRSQHSLINLLFQSTGAIIVDYAAALFDQKMGEMFMDNQGRPFYQYKKKIVRRVGYWHDELVTEAEEPVAKEVAKIMDWCMVEAGLRLKLNVPLVGESKIGEAWDQTH